MVYVIIHVFVNQCFPLTHHFSFSSFAPSQAANHLNIRGLLDLTCQTVADMMTGKTPEEIRKIFNINEKFKPGEEEEIRKENQQAFE